jgi:RNA polymerase sigma-70 factor (ECF subfamily)
MLGLAVRILRNQHEAEDVVGDVLLELWHRHERFEASRGSAVSYLLLVTRSRCIDRLRKRRSSGEKRLPVALSASDGSLPVEMAALREMGQTVRQAVETLPEPQRSTLHMAFFDGMTHRDIAEATETPIGTVKGHIRRSLLKLRNHLRSHDPAEGGGG